MKLTDIIALAKEGYTPSDIKELLALAEDHGTSTNENNIEEDKTVQPSESPTSVDDIESVEDEPDYKKLFEESQAMIKRIQAININKDVDSNNSISDQDLISDFVKNFGK